MYADTEGFVLKQIKIAGGRRMIMLFSKRFGKISAGTGMTEKGRGKAALAVRPFTYGRYDLNKTREQYYINGAEVLKSYYRIGEDVDKYMCSSYVLELTEKALAEGQPTPELFTLLLDFFDAMEQREKKHDTLMVAYEIKMLQRLGHEPNLHACARCGARVDDQNAKQSEPVLFSVADGGLLCDDCAQEAIHNDGLIYELNFAIVNIMQYLMKSPWNAFRRLALQQNMQEKLQKLLKAYIEYHLNIGSLKSEGFTMDILTSHE